MGFAFYIRNSAVFRIWEMLGSFLQVVGRARGAGELWCGLLVAEHHLAPLAPNRGDLVHALIIHLALGLLHAPLRPFHGCFQPPMRAPTARLRRETLFGATRYNFFHTKNKSNPMHWLARIHFIIKNSDAL